MGLPLLALFVLRQSAGSAAPPPVAAMPEPKFGVPDDARLARAVVVERRFGLLSESVADLAAGTRIPLSVAPAMRNLKAVLLTGPGRSASATMRDLADLFDAEWKDDGNGGLRLTENDEGTSLRAQALKEELKVARKFAEYQLRRIARDVSTWGDKPWEEWASAYRATERTVKSEPSRAADIWRSYHERWGTGLFPGYAWIGEILSKLDEGGGERFLAGEPLWGSTAPSAGRHRLSPRREPPFFAPEGEVCRVFMRYFPWAGHVEAVMRVGVGMAVSIPVTNVEKFGEYDFVSWKTPLGQRWNSWRTDISRSSDPLLSAPLGQNVAPPAATCLDGAKPVFTFADHAARLHDEYRVPVIAEALRYERDWPSYEEGYGRPSLRDALLDEWQRGPMYHTRLARGAVLVRPPSGWRYRPFEPDEAVARGLEKTSGKSLDSYANAYSRMSPSARAGAAHLAWRVDRSPFRSPALLTLWQQLSPSERTALLRGGEVRARPGLNLTEAIGEALFSAEPSPAFLRRFDAESLDLSDLSLFGGRGLRSEAGVRWKGYGNARASEEFSAGRSEYLVVTLGASREDGIALSCRVPGSEIIAK